MVNPKPIIKYAIEAARRRGDDTYQYLDGTTLVTVTGLQSAKPDASCINRKLWDPEERWYRSGSRVAWYDNKTQSWIAHDVDEDGHQVSDADYYGHRDSFLEPQFAALSTKQRRKTMNTTTYNPTRAQVRAAFSELRKLGWFARMNFWCCQTCGYAAADDSKPIVFFHQQDTERAFDGEDLVGGLYLSHDPQTEKTGRNSYEAVGVLVAHGLRVKWDGDYSQRILVEGRND